MSITLELAPETERELRRYARKEGVNVDEYVVGLLESKLKFFPFALETLELLQPVWRNGSRQTHSNGKLLMFLLEAASALADAPEGRGSKLKSAMRLYEKQVASLGLAAELAGVSRAEFIDALGKAQIPVFQYSADEALADADMLCRRL